MSLRHLTLRAILPGMLFLLAGLLLFGCGEVQTTRPQSAKKDCLDCHKKFADQYLGMKNVHSVVKEKKCESCHLRHGLLPKLLLKKPGNEVCYACHSREKIGLNRKNVHTVL